MRFSVFAIAAVLSSPSISYAMDVVGYLPNWVSAITATNLPWNLYTHINYFAAVPQADYSLGQFDSGNVASLVSAAHSNGVTISLTIGGWGQCDVCSSAMNDNNRATFVSNIVAAINKYDFDGIDIDWEYPNSQGAGGAQQYGPNDTANLLKTFQALRSALGSGKLLTAAVATTPFNDANGNPSSNVSGFNDVVDYLSIMNYDTYGTYQIGPNSPLDDHCGKGYPGSASQSVGDWEKAGMSMSKLTLGMPYYGYAYSASSIGQYGGNPSVPARPVPGNNNCTNTPANQIHGPVRCGDDIAPNYQNGPGNRLPQKKRSLYRRSADEGQINVSDMVKKGYLSISGGKLVAAGNWQQSEDTCSPNPYIFGQSQQELISYDDTDSLSTKALWAKNQGLRGVMIWSMDGDTYSDGSNVLATAIGYAVGNLNLPPLMNGTWPYGNGTFTNGTFTNGTFTNGTFTNGTLTNGTYSGGNASATTTASAGTCFFTMAK